MVAGRRVLASAGLVLGDLAALVALRPDAGALAGDIAAPHAWVAATGADGAAITLAGTSLWCVALWLGVGLLAAVATQLPGCVGRIARSLSRALLPAGVYRIVAGAAGLGVLLAPVAAGASVSPPGGGSPAATSSSVPSIPAPTWPTAPRPTPRVPTPIWPLSPAATSPGQAGEPTRASADPSPRPAAHPPRARSTSPGRRVVVRPGDSLWGIAANRLGPAARSAQIAAAWPRWYAANRPVIGADPGLIRPGQLLQPPTSPESPQ